MPQVSDLFIYPIKSCRTIPVNQAEVSLKGFVGDRQFMWIDSSNQFVTQRTFPLFAKVQVELLGNAIKLSVDDGTIEPFEFQPTLTGTPRNVKIW